MITRLVTISKNTNYLLLCYFSQSGRLYKDQLVGEPTVVALKGFRRNSTLRLNY